MANGFVLFVKGKKWHTEFIQFNRVQCSKFIDFPGNSQLYHNIKCTNNVGGSKKIV